MTTAKAFLGKRSRLNSNNVAYSVAGSFYSSRACRVDRSAKLVRGQKPPVWAVAFAPRSRTWLSAWPPTPGNLPSSSRPCDARGRKNFPTRSFSLSRPKSCWWSRVSIANATRGIGRTVVHKALCYSSDTRDPRRGIGLCPVSVPAAIMCACVFGARARREATRVPIALPNEYTIIFAGPQFAPTLLTTPR